METSWSAQLVLEIFSKVNMWGNITWYFLEIESRRGHFWWVKAKNNLSGHDYEQLKLHCNRGVQSREITCSSYRNSHNNYDWWWGLHDQNMSPCICGSYVLSSTTTFVLLKQVSKLRSCHYQEDTNQLALLPICIVH